MIYYTDNRETVMGKSKRPAEKRKRLAAARARGAAAAVQKRARECGGASGLCRGRCARLRRGGGRRTQSQLSGAIQSSPAAAHSLRVAQNGQ